MIRYFIYQYGKFIGSCAIGEAKPKNMTANQFASVSVQYKPMIP